MAKLTIKQQKMLPQMEQKRNNQKRPNYVQNIVDYGEIEYANHEYGG